MSKPRNGFMARNMKDQAPLVSIIVANWNGKDWIARCLSSLQLSARATKATCELIVVDDASTDGSDRIVEERFPTVRLYRNPTNLGFAQTINRGVEMARGRLVILCNNDLAAKEAFVPRLISHFRRAKKEGRPLFAVGARTISWYDGEPNQLCMGAVWQGGRITPAWTDPKETAECLFVQAGAAAYDRRLYKKLGGLSDLYAPGYWEDYDLSWRAAKTGYQMLYDPKALALHYGGGSMGKRYGSDGVAAMKARNHVIFELANLTSKKLLAEWLLRLPLSLAREAGKHDKAGSFSRALAETAPLLANALRRRLTLSRQVSDGALLKRYHRFKASFQ